MQVGVRTRDGTAQAETGNDYVHFDEIISFSKSETEKQVEIQIVDDNEWEPEKYFYVELYDVETQEKYEADDTECIVTILDEDFPGTMAIEKTNITAFKHWEEVVITV